MSGIILYKSKYGSTKKYAEWLAEETGFAPMDVGNASIEDVSQYDTVLFGEASMPPASLACRF